MKSDGESVRAVVDANVFVSAIIIERGVPYAVLRAWRFDQFELVMPFSEREELSRVLQRPRLVERYRISAKVLDDLLARLDSITPAMLAPELPVAVRDPKDVDYLAAALGERADFLITGDKDLLVLRDDPRIAPLRIVTAAEFLGHLQEG